MLRACSGQESRRENQVKVKNNITMNRCKTVSTKVREVRLITIALTSFGLLGSITADAADLGPVHLRCEYLQNPLGIDVAKPRLSWELESATRGETQVSAQILVASSRANLDAGNGDLWNTTINTGASFQIEYGGAALQTGKECWWKVKVRGKNASYDWSAPAFWSMGLPAKADWDGAKWIGADAPSAATPSPMLRKPFTLGKAVKRAMVYATGQAAYELHLNGRKVSDHILDPGWTDFRKRVLYQTFDVTAMINHAGENTLGAVLGDGWYNMNPYGIFPRGMDGNAGRKLLLKLAIEHTDGTTTTVVSDDTWKMQADGYIRAADIFLGETIDSRNYQKGWDATGYDDKSWSAPKVYVVDRPAITAQVSESIRMEMDVKPVAMTQPSPGVYIFDMGQNMVGWSRLNLTGTAGQVVNLRHAEKLNPDGALHTANLYHAAQRDTFILNGVDASIEPHFTYHGYRYVEVTGLTSAPTTELITGRVFHSAATPSGSFNCSNPLLNKIWSNVLWSQRGNHMSIPTDCPQRDERLGWMGDAQVFAQTAIFNWGMAPFYAKWVQDIRDGQRADGQFQDWVPSLHSGDTAPAWGDAGVIIPWRLYQNYGDLRLIKEHFSAVKRWVDQTHANNPDHLWLNKRGNDCGDWLDGSKINVPGYAYPAAGGVPKEVFATLFFYHSARLCAKMASASGLAADALTYSSLADDIGGAFNNAYVNASTGVIEGNSQAGYALALQFEILPDAIRAKAAEHMNNEVVNTYDTRLSTGFNATLPLLMQLTRWGYNETAYKLAESRRLPSWGYCIDKDATTIWEVWWEGFDKPSFNHYAFGAVGEWFYRVILGINYDESQPGYKHFMVKPQPGGTLVSAEGSYRSISGEIRSQWELKANGVFALNVTVPANTTAEISIPKRNDSADWAVQEGQGNCWRNGEYQSGVSGITGGSSDSQWVTFTVGSGDYSFEAGSQAALSVAGADKAPVGVTATAAAAPASAGSIVCPADAPANVKLAAKEIRRYVYLRTGKLLPITADAGAIVLRVDSALEPQQYRLKSEGERLTITGGSDVGVLYGAYRYAELLGVRFYLHEDVLPDEPLKELPAVDETAKPVFGVRGILPFHDFAQGPDLWEADDYKAVLSQMVKLRMNFIGLHNYSECGWGSEPTVWIGMPDDVGTGGRPKFSYSSYYANTERTTGGQKAARTHTFGYGASELFESDVWGPSVMRGLMPHGNTVEEKNEVFARTGGLLSEAFTYAHRFGVKTCVGTETPLTHPTRFFPMELRAHLKEQGKSIQDPEVHKALYRGIFQRAMKTYPLDYYWLWTHEGWRLPQSDAEVQQAQDDLERAVAAAKEVGAPFTLATAGWALGPLKDRTMFDRLLPKTMPFSALNLELGSVPVDEGFARLKGRPGWAIPWLEDDLGLSVLQLWVGRIRRDAYDAARYGCEGLIGIHWRTEEVGPMAAALAQAQWNVPQAPVETKVAVPAIVVHGGNAAGFAEPVAGANGRPVYKTVRWDTSGYDFSVTNGSYRVTLQFNEPAYDRAGKRVFGVTVQGETVERRLDIFERVGKNHALDLTFDQVKVTQGKLSIGFLKNISSQLLEADRKALDAGYADFPCIAGIIIEGPQTLKLNCGGPAWQDYVAEPGPPSLPRYLPVQDFYTDWAASQFGTEAAAEIAAIFSRIDGHLPAPMTGCPGGLTTNGSPWEQARGAYNFVDELAALRPRIRGAGQQARFDKWVTIFEYLRVTGKVGCGCGEIDRAMAELAAIKEPAARRQFAQATVLPVRIQLNEDWGRMMTLAIQTADTWGGIGVVMGQELMNRGEINRLECHDPALRAALDENLPASALPWMEYRGTPRLFAVTKRSVVERGESLSLRIIALDKAPVKSVFVKVRPFGGEWQTIPVTHLARAVYEAKLPTVQDDFEYYITAETTDDQKLVWPATAPSVNQTVVVAE
jgi:alpha-L-rhamnosidase